MLQPGNWREFDSFAWYRAYNEDNFPAEEYAIVYTDNRDSGLIDRANAKAIEDILAPYMESADEDWPDVIEECHNHCVCGYINGYAIRVYRNGEKTAAAQAWEDIERALKDHPILDESTYDELCAEAESEAWESWAEAEFIRLLEKEFGVELEFPNDNQCVELFRTLCDRSNTYWETVDEVNIDMGRIVSSAEMEDIYKYIVPNRVHIYCDGMLLEETELRAGALRCLCPLYESEFETIESAINNGQDSVTIDGKVYTWDIY